MSQIKQLQPKEGVTLLAVKVPEGFNFYELSNNRLYYSGGEFIDFLCDYIVLPEGNWQPLGIATEIPEEVWRNIMPEEASINNEVVKIKFLDIKSNKVFNRPKKAAISFLEANEVYSVNPLGQFKPHWSDDIDNWQQAEANTGTWVILMKQND